MLEQLAVWGVGGPHSSHRLLVWVAATLGGTALIATLSWYWIEQPALRLKSRFPLRPRRRRDPALATGGSRVR